MTFSGPGHNDSSNVRRCCQNTPCFICHWRD